MILALYQPDIPHNTGTLARLTACLGLPLHIIEPAGFVMTDKAVKRSGLDYLDFASVVKHDDFEAFQAFCAGRNKRIVLLTTKAERSYLDYEFSKDDVLLMGRESVGAPQHVHDGAHARLKIPLVENARSLNMAVCASMVLGEALRQTGGFPG